MGWFYGLKLHFVINHKGQIMALKITPGNTADSTVLDEMTRHLAGKLYADKGYIGRELFHKLWRRGLHLITSIRRNMRNHLMPLADKVMLRKRFVIETVLDTLKSEMGLEHSRHRSVVNAMVHVLSRCLRVQTRQALHFTDSTKNHGLSIAGVTGVCQPAWSSTRMACAFGARLRAISSRWCCIACVSARGMTTAAPAPRLGQIAPNR